jgi:alkylation response protein AidB-like acyl-CoA dehydrogenase
LNAAPVPVAGAGDDDLGAVPSQARPAHDLPEQALPEQALPEQALLVKALLAKAAAGQAALLAARHCQQVLGGIGFTAEHALHHHVKRVLVLDGLLGSARELTREAGRGVIADGRASRLVDL